MDRDPWIVLGLQRNASDTEIKERYRELARELHPDRNPGNREAAQRFQDVSWAYDALRTEERRLKWQAENESILDFQGEAEFKGNLQLSFLEAFSGAQKKVTVEVEEVCPSCAGSGAAPGTSPRRCERCQGSGQISLGGMSESCNSCAGRGYTIPEACSYCTFGRRKEMRNVIIPIAPGAYSGQEIIFSEGPRSFLFRVEVEPSPIFERSLPDPADLLLRVPITFPEALLGAAIRIPTPEKVVEMQVPAGTPSGKNLRIQGAGMPRSDGTRGDLYAQITVDVPKEASSSLRRLAEKVEEDGEELRSGLFRF